MREPLNQFADRLLDNESELAEFIEGLCQKQSNAALFIRKTIEAWEKKEMERVFKQEYRWNIHT